MRTACLFAGFLFVLLPFGSGKEPVPANDWRHYNEATSFLDEKVGRVLQALETAGLDEETIVVFMSDNGYMMGERGIGGPGSGPNGKTVPYESSIRVPLILRGPGVPGDPGPSDLPVSSLDLPVTLLSLAGAPIPEDWPGRDLLAGLAGEISIEEAISELSDEESEIFGPLAFRSVRTPETKLIDWKNPDRQDELYDLTADPREGRNLIDAPAWQETAADLRDRLRSWIEATGDPALGW